MLIRPTHRLCVLNTIIELVFLVLREFGSFLSAKIVSIQPYFSSALLATKIIDLFAIAKNMLKEFPLVKSANSLGCLIKRYLSNTDLPHNKQKKAAKSKTSRFQALLSAAFSFRYAFCMLRLWQSTPLPRFSSLQSSLLHYRSLLLSLSLFYDRLDKVWHILCY